MAQKILYLVSEDWYFVSHRLPMARAALGAAGRRIVEDEFSHLRIGQEIVALYRRLLSQGPGAGSLLRPPGPPG